MGDATGAAQAYQAGFELTEGLMDAQQLVGGYTNLAHMWVDAGDASRAEEYLLKALEVYGDENDGAPTTAFAGALENMCEFYEFAVSLRSVPKQPLALCAR